VLDPPDGASATACERRLRLGPVPVVARVEKERVVLDLRTVFPEQEPALIKMLRSAFERS
ncbi:MAG TPA: hypothetical protein VEU62_21395, partial [Bryobacterales bacterium]|nr:hypothetical protein [Bryobacterales bacterium]